MPEHTFLDELPLYALGALALEERKRLEPHLLDGCESCRFELARMESAVASLPYAQRMVAPPVRLKERLLANVGAQVIQPERFQRRGAQLFLLAASLLLAAVLGTLWLLARRDVAVLDAEKKSLIREGKLAVKAKEVAWLHDPRVQIALLKGLESTSLARAKLLFDPVTAQGLFYVDGLPPLPLEKSYALWAFVNDSPVPAGVFETSSDSAVLSLSQQGALAKRPSEFAVSIEPRGGGPKPTGAIVLIGETF